MPLVHAVSGPPRRHSGLSRCKLGTDYLFRHTFRPGRRLYNARTSANMFTHQSCSVQSAGRSKKQWVVAVGKHVVILGRPRPRFLPFLRVGCRRSSLPAPQPITAGNPQTDLSCRPLHPKTRKRSTTLAKCICIASQLSNPHRRPIKKLTLLRFLVLVTIDPPLDDIWQFLLKTWLKEPDAYGRSASHGSTATFLPPKVYDQAVRILFRPMLTHF